MKGIYLNDKVKAFGQTGWVTGFSGTSSVYIKNREGEYITVPGKNHKMVPLAELSVRTHCNNWAVSDIKTISNRRQENCDAEMCM